MNLLPLKFEYRGTGYETLLRIKEKDNVTEYHITVMNGELEKMLYGHHVLVLENGSLQCGVAPDAETALLKNSIAEALSHWLETANQKTRKLLTI
ncbi:MAG: hypothetical protein JST39_03390 [Bacteroidetes bacterium]|nr:hypothetical protein [Bacteroidota bacterium]